MDIPQERWGTCDPHIIPDLWPCRLELMIVGSRNSIWKARGSHSLPYRMKVDQELMLSWPRMSATSLWLCPTSPAVIKLERVSSHMKVSCPPISCMLVGCGVLKGKLDELIFF